MKTTRRLAVNIGVIATVLLPAVLLLLWSDDEEIRYMEDTCIGSVVMPSGHPGVNVALAFVGSSRVMAAARPDRNAPYVDLFPKEDIFVDLSRNHRGMEHNFTIAKDLLGTHKVKNLIVEINNSRTKHHINFYQKASLLDILDETVFHMTRFAFGEAQESFQMLAERIGDRITKLGNEKKRYPVNEGQFIDCSVSDDLVEPKQFRQAKNRYSTFDEYRSKQALDLKDDDANERMLFYVSKLIDLANSHDTCIHFIYYPVYYGKFFSEVAEKSFFNLTGKRLHQLDQRAQQQLYETPAAFFDPLHLAESGSDFFEKWMVANVPLCR